MYPIDAVKVRSPTKPQQNATSQSNALTWPRRLECKCSTPIPPYRTAALFAARIKWRLERDFSASGEACPA